MLHKIIIPLTLIVCFSGLLIKLPVKAPKVDEQIVASAENEENAPIENLDPYPELHVEFNGFKEIDPNKKVAYLTFDDGPSLNTPGILDVLRVENVKATFFVAGGEPQYKKDLLRQIVNEGHTIGIHTYTHNYKEIYKSKDAFLHDFAKEFNLIYYATGVKPSVFRFPGGSINSFNQNIYNELIEELTSRGFTYYDWNMSSDDAIGKYTEEQQYNKLVKEMGSKKKIIALMHDGGNNKSSAYVSQKFIWHLKKSGFEIEKIDNTVKPITFAH